MVCFFKFSVVGLFSLLSLSLSICLNIFLLISIFWCGPFGQYWRSGYNMWIGSELIHLMFWIRWEMKFWVRYGSTLIQFWSKLSRALQGTISTKPYSLLSYGINFHFFGSLICIIPKHGLFTSLKDGKGKIKSSVACLFLGPWMCCACSYCIISCSPVLVQPWFGCRWPIKIYFCLLWCFSHFSWFIIRFL